MEGSNLGQQIESSIDELHVLFDEIGVATQERETREAQLFAALSEALNRYVRHVSTEKKDLVDEAKTIIVAIRQMEASLEDPRHRDVEERDDLKVAFPLTRCLQVLREKHGQVARLHKERYEQVMKLAEALGSYASHLEPTFVKISLPPLGSNRSIPLTFDLSPSYVGRLDAEFTRVYEEYNRRLAAVQALGEHIVQLWADLEVPQNQQDAAITQHYRDAPEQLGLHEEDMERLSSNRDRLAEEKRTREERLQSLRAAVEDLWEKLGVDFEETQAFLEENRGCGIRRISEFEEELERLNELKRQNLQYFVEDARLTLQELWDGLYLSEDEMLEFTPAFSDAYSDALLEAHEREIKRLVALKEERGPTLNAVAKYKGLIKDRDELIASCQDPSRLMLRGQKGGKRDPGRLIREEKMRKRIAKELPRATVEVRKVLEQWEVEHGRPFLVHGERFLGKLEAEEDATATKRPARTRTPAPQAAAAAAPPKMPGSAHARAMSSHSNASSVSNPPPLKSVSSRTMLKTPIRAGEAPTKQASQSHQVVSSQAALVMGTGTQRDACSSPSRRAPAARAPLSSLKNGVGSPDRRPRQSPSKRKAVVEALSSGAPIRAPPPKMRSFVKPIPELDASRSPYRSVGPDPSPSRLKSSGVVRAIEAGNVYDDDDDDDRSRHILRSVRSESSFSQRPVSSHSSEGSHPPSIRMLPPLARQRSSTSYATTLCGSENWETYDDDDSDPEADVSQGYVSELRTVGGKRPSPEQGHLACGSPAKRARRRG